MPPDVMEPAEALQVSWVFVAFLTCDVNCCEPPEATVPLVGDTVTAPAPACVVIV